MGRRDGDERRDEEEMVRSKVRFKKQVRSKSRLAESRANSRKRRRGCSQFTRFTLAQPRPRQKAINSRDPQ